MKNIKRNVIAGALFFLLGGCTKPPRNYYADEDNPGLSRLTNYGYNIATNYLNGVAYINPYNNSSYYSEYPPNQAAGNVIPTLTKIAGNTNDTLALSWPVEQNIDYPIGVSFIDLLIIVPKNFILNNLAALNGKRFADSSNSISVSSRYYYFPIYNYGYNDSSGIGKSNIYFVNVKVGATAISMTGLFNGQIGAGTLITDGRFDFNIPTGYVHL